MSGFPEKAFNKQIRNRGITDSLVLKAMQKTNRGAFVPDELQKWTYDDRPLPIGQGQTISQPYVVAWMLQWAALRATDRVLEIGTGSGYQTALLAQICKSVYTIEIRKDLLSRAQEVLQQQGFHNISYRLGSGFDGWPEAAPFDAILVSAAPPHMPSVLVDQLAPGGRMILPLGGESQNLIKLVNCENYIEFERSSPVKFVPMIESIENKARHNSH